VKRLIPAKAEDRHDRALKVIQSPTMAGSPASVGIAEGA